MEGYLGDTWRIWLENAIFLPFLLVFLLNRNERVSLFGLRLLEMKNTSKTSFALTPFNSFVLARWTSSRAFATASEAAISACSWKKIRQRLPDFILNYVQNVATRHNLVAGLAESSKLRVGCVPRGKIPGGESFYGPCIWQTRRLTYRVLFGRISDWGLI